MYPGDIIFFLRGIPLMAALGASPSSEAQRACNCALAIWISCCCSPGGFSCTPSSFFLGCTPSLRSGQYNYTYDVDHEYSEHRSPSSGSACYGCTAAVPGAPYTPICSAAVSDVHDLLADDQRRHQPQEVLHRQSLRPSAGGLVPVVGAAGFIAYKSGTALTTPPIRPAPEAADQKNAVKALWRRGWPWPPWFRCPFSPSTP